jgi:hypothetical protein
MRLALFLLFIILCGDSYSQTVPITKMLRISRSNYGLSYPENWSLDTSRRLGADLFLFSPQENEMDKFRENVNVLIQNLQGQNIDLKRYKQITDNQITNLATDSKVFESSILQGEKGEFFKMSYTMSQNQLMLQVTSICFIHKELAYLVTFTSEANKYGNYQRISDVILNSFSLTK